MTQITGKFYYQCVNCGQTPLYRVKQIDDQSIKTNLLIKDDSQNPTYSFKDRASAMVSAFAGFLNYLNNDRLIPQSVNIVLLTGSGLKDLKAVQNIISIPEAIEPSLSQLKKLVS